MVGHTRDEQGRLNVIRRGRHCTRDGRLSCRRDVGRWLEELSQRLNGSGALLNVS